ncbi:MAG TPA: prolyl oligopeptidase family serine peptidase [Oscillospiraceae bacterium]|nr:prolyl oligopeptidase family serine peptidase [Oscillospiraceae bacterium]HPK35477.1 prolyl oligopeptidase family serine peptidase [Oscillospiraceae bacterium]HPR75201.1 prolyl oligopeptidase family serine peptidase [Oscillospiraceae bacterium]
MKKFCIAFILILCTLLCACGNIVTGNSPATTASSSEPTKTESDIAIEEYKTIEDLVGYADVVSISRVTYDFSEMETSFIDEETETAINEVTNDTITYEIVYTVDGFRITGYISAPSDYLTNNYPILIYNRGGNGDYGANTAESIARYAYYFQYIVVATQYRETGIGTGRDRFGGEDVNDVLFLVNMTQSIAFGDQDKVYMLGVSRGGMETCLAIRQDTNSVIKAAVSVSGVYDLESLYSFRTDMQDVLKNRIGGTPSEVPEEYEKRSAVTFADQINIPILIIHSTRDQKTPYSDAKNFAELLEQYDKSYEFITRRDNAHGIESPDEINTIIEWFESL